MDDIVGFLRVSVLLCLRVKSCLELEGNMSQGREGPAEQRALVFTLCASDWASSHILSSLYGLGLY